MSQYDIVFPNYNCCCVNLISSICGYFGVQNDFAPLSEISRFFNAKYHNIVLLILDGLGSYSLREHLSQKSFLRTNHIYDLSAVFPSTTVAATTSLRTGTPPVQHGWIGWTMYFPQIDKNVDVFSNYVQFTKETAAAYHVCSTYLPVTEVTNLVTKTGRIQGFSVSSHDSICVKNMNQLTDQIVVLCKQDGQKYIYAYYNQPDENMHLYGIHSQQVCSMIQKLNIQVESLANKLPGDTLLLITGDHGVLDTTPVYIEDNPFLTKMLIRPPVLEPRATAFYIKPEYINLFPSAFYDVFGDEFLLVESKKAIEKGLFGPGHPRNDLLQYLGNYLALAVGDKALYPKRNHTVPLIGMHAGLTKVEMEVPLMVISTK